MKRVAVDAVGLMTVDEEATAEDVAGCIVRLQPSASVDEDQLRAKADELRASALALKVLPRPASDKLVIGPGNTGVTQLPTNTRGFVLELATKSSSKRMLPLLEYIEELADRQGI